MAKNDITEKFSTGPYNAAFAFKRTVDGYNLEVRTALPSAQNATHLRWWPRDRL